LQTVALPLAEISYDPVKNVTKKRETWRLGVMLDDMWAVFKGDTEDHIEMLIRDKEVFLCSFIQICQYCIQPVNTYIIYTPDLVS
jgi:hypothetical protein